MALRVGVWLTSPMQAGGGFRLSLATIALLVSSTRMHHTFAFFTTYRPNVALLRDLGIDAVHVSYGRFRKALGRVAQNSRVVKKLNQLTSRHLRLNLDPSLDGIVKRKAIDLLYFLEPTDLMEHLSETNYVATVLDLCHREFMEFPEVRRFFQAREKRYELFLPSSVAIITNWDSLSKQITQYYGVDSRRIFVLPHLPQSAAQNSNHASSASGYCEKNYQIPRPYIFYPANFWGHKNHVYILEALALLRDKLGVALHAAFCGVDMGNLEVVRRAANSIGLSDRVHVLGLVSDGDIRGLYERALALVMPTYFGPTNMPPLEAAVLGCPIVYSDLEPFRQQFRDGALYCELSRPESLADQLERLLMEPELSARLVERARAVIPKDADIQYEDTLNEIFDRYEFISRRWQ